MRLWLIIAGTLLLDAAGKALVRKQILDIPFVENSGLAFGIQAGGLAAIILTAVILAVLFFYYQQNKIFLKNVIAFGLIFGGAIGNLLERIIFRNVTDFIPLGKAMLNIADLAIFLGLTMLVVKLMVTKFENSKLKIEN
ncbi:MAG: hypothetical protein A3J48_00255 [Candidatus Doudnabacteria bacterium RIFCSPHIGHO2_02_FULL_46_11]|uniref:Lipoprotein signal peptidase n=1 Tax=Candidatus Doudnabacteria bacterium RIFCSPHIGHO2_02_FULL_46_11 TaxID=1817832 RepID=A0A1F5P6S8_9BACT|nr:MAG: hypothetical protein A3J48_00255 [Candidatus Doudnabacteria bacterium RIFCSPHIGHO2_02_FULL_46_11]